MVFIDQDFPNNLAIELKQIWNWLIEITQKTSLHLVPVYAVDYLFNFDKFEGVYVAGEDFSEFVDMKEPLLVLEDFIPEITWDGYLLRIANEFIGEDSSNWW